MRTFSPHLAAGFATAAATLSAAALAFAATIAGTQTTPQAIVVVNRMNSAYRSFRSYYDVATIKRKQGKKEDSASLTLAMEKPNKFLLDLKGEHLNTVILSDGNTLIALRPDRQAYTKTKAPIQVINGDFIGNVDMPSLGARIIAQLLAANGREGEIGKLLINAKVAGPLGFGNKLAYVLTIPYGDDTEARVYVTSDDYLVRQVKLVKSGAVEWTEDHANIQLDKPVPAVTFLRPLPDNALMVASLPSLDKPSEAASADAGNTPDSTGDAAKDAAPSAVAAKAVYRSAGCARCHDGGQGPDLSHEGAEPAHTVKWIADHIKNPSTHTPGSRMPSFAGRLSDKNIQTLATYLASLK